MRKTVRKFGKQGEVTVKALECGKVAVSIWGHAALRLPHRSRINDHWEVMGEHCYRVEVCPMALSCALEDAYDMADRALASEQSAINAVEQCRIWED
jgi:hypothetical protein